MSRIRAQEKLEIVGVAKNVRDGWNLRTTEGPAFIYVPMRPANFARPSLQGVTLVVRGLPRA